MLLAVVFRSTPCICSLRVQSRYIYLQTLKYQKMLYCCKKKHNTSINVRNPKYFQKYVNIPHSTSILLFNLFSSWFYDYETNLLKGNGKYFSEIFDIIFIHSLFISFCKNTWNHCKKSVQYQVYSNWRLGRTHEHMLSWENIYQNISFCIFQLKKIKNIIYIFNISNILQQLNSQFVFLV